MGREVSYDTDYYASTQVIPPHKDNIVAIIVTFHPDERLAERIAATVEQVNRIIIVDNCSNDHAIETLRKIASDPHIELLENGRNKGIAAALNQGVQLATIQGYKWILMLDQDSKPEPSMIDRLISAYNCFPENNKVAIVTPTLVDERTDNLVAGYANSDVRYGQDVVQVKYALTSGTLLAVSVFALAGPFQEDLFIDYVDYEYCLRLRKLDFMIILARKARLQHNLGSPSYHKFLWKRGALTANHSALRRYYMTRNRLLIIKAYARREPTWAISNLFALVKQFAKILLFEKNRRTKSQYMWLGIKDAALNKTGEFSRTNPHNGSRRSQ